MNLYLNKLNDLQSLFLLYAEDFYGWYAANRQEYPGEFDAQVLPLLESILADKSGKLHRKTPEEARILDRAVTDFWFCYCASLEPSEVKVVEGGFYAWRCHDAREIIEKYASRTMLQRWDWMIEGRTLAQTTFDHQFVSPEDYLCWIGYWTPEEIASLNAEMKKVREMMSEAEYEMHQIPIDCVQRALGVALESRMGLILDVS
ncbi:hypothetical protein [Chitinimonas lacunae]|uniref:CdiI immunity protein domain-containing protein n=1 Tax=Chitinimonas lacunae TaxID=1963018 RepID=A0ABV8MWU3_9NEIS